VSPDSASVAFLANLPPPPESFQPVLDFIQRETPEAIPSYPPFWSLKQHLFRRTLYTWISDNLNDSFVAPMKDLSFDELDELAATFKFENCEKRSQMVELMKEHAWSG
jgi:hypothetical protein